MAKQKTKNQIQTHHNAYNKLVSHPEMVKALLTGFVDAEIVRHFDLNTLQKQSGNYVTDDLRDRESEFIWRMRFKDNWIYIYCWNSNQALITGWLYALHNISACFARTS